MIKHKKKICRKCKKLSYYWTTGLCKNCSPKKKYVYRRKPTNEKKLFLEIWEEREHYCTNCKTFLGHAPMAHYFSHIIPKSRDASKRLDPDNIQLLCVVCHYTHDFRGKEKFEEMQKSI